MATENYASRLRYLDADDLDDSTVSFDGLDVRGANDDKLGDLDGFVVDSGSGRVYYAVVDSGGWFSSRRFLLPIGHATIDDDRRAMRVDVTKDAVKRFPEFDADRFRKFTDDELRAFEQRMAVACCPDDAGTVATTLGYDTLRHYSQPGWWKAEYSRTERYRPLDRSERERAETARSSFDRKHVTAREGDRDRTGDVSPHYEGRAQPGDVLGVETGGERTYIGDTTEDENKRRRDAERDRKPRP
jgi:hypothetical protein